MVSKTDRMLKSMKQTTHRVTPIVNDMILPNYNGAQINDGHLIGKKVGAFGWLDHSSTVIIALETYQPIDGVFNVNPVEGFSGIGDSNLTYDLNLMQWFEIDWHASISGNLPSTTIHCAIFKNGSLVLGSEMSTFLLNLNQQYNLSGTAAVELKKDDIVTLVVRSNGVGDVIEFHHMTATISEFFD